MQLEQCSQKGDRIYEKVLQQALRNAPTGIHHAFTLRCDDGCIDPGDIIQWVAASYLPIRDRQRMGYRWHQGQVLDRLAQPKRFKIRITDGFGVGAGAFNINKIIYQTERLLLHYGCWKVANE